MSAQPPVNQYELTNKEILDALKSITSPEHTVAASPSSPSALPPSPPLNKISAVEVGNKNLLESLLLILLFEKLPNHTTAIPNPNPPTIVNDLKDIKVTSLWWVNSILSKLEKNIFGKKLDDDKTRTIEDHINAKYNLAKILYFIALHFCGAIVNNGTTTDQQFIASTTDDGKTQIKAKNKSPEYIIFAKKLFIIASSFADNTLVIEGDNTTRVKDSEKILNFIEDIIDPRTHPDSPPVAADAASASADAPDAAANTKEFKTHLLKIKDDADTTINLRVIQTVLLDRIVTSSEPYSKDQIVYTDITEDVKGAISHLLNELKITITAAKKSTTPQ